MIESDKREIPELQASNDLPLGALLDLFSAHAGAPLVFNYQGRSVKPGYHVTEVKAGRFEGLDCGANPEAWSEVFVQLWDVDESGRTHMPAGKFAAIIGKVAAHTPLDPAAKLTFEVSDGVRPIALHRAASARLAGDAIHVALEPRAASCKPRDRWLEAQSTLSGCCAPRAACCA
ncbi:DUF6428 family protein [Terrarubrum flagellatum]|uniref:DUF6428 family protein n=1 Tax=Terrirubrum flagellatum TaxID=2895980 RepID=UPI003144F9D7